MDENIKKNRNQIQNISKEISEHFDNISVKEFEENLIKAGINMYNDEYLLFLIQKYKLHFEWTVESQHDKSFTSVYSNQDFMIQFIFHDPDIYRLRSDFHETFDRWGNCLFEEEFRNKEEFMFVVKMLEDFSSQKEQIIKEERF